MSIYEFRQINLKKKSEMCENPEVKQMQQCSLKKKALPEGVCKQNSTLHSGKILFL